MEYGSHGKNTAPPLSGHSRGLLSCVLLRRGPVTEEICPKGWYCLAVKVGEGGEPRRWGDWRKEPAGREGRVWQEGQKTTRSTWRTEVDRVGWERGRRWGAAAAGLGAPGEVGWAGVPAGAGVSPSALSRGVGVNGTGWTAQALIRRLCCSGDSAHPMPGDLGWLDCYPPPRPPPPAGFLSRFPAVGCLGLTCWEAEPLAQPQDPGAEARKHNARKEKQRVPSSCCVNISNGNHSSQPA